MLRLCGLLLALVALASAPASAGATLSANPCTGSVLGRAEKGPECVEDLSVRLRGGFDGIKDKATGIDFPGTLQAAGKTLQVR